MAKQTSANMQPCKGVAAERHNRRDKDLDYIRKDLTPLNHYREWISISNQMHKIQSEYKAATGQNLQPSAQPIQEIVLVIDKDTTPEQVETFCSLTKSLGMTPLSYAIHKDEGHTDAGTGEWIPNYHAHIVVDTTCWEHKQVERTKKKNGKNVINSKTHKPEKVMVDAYAKTIKFTREDMSRLQDFAAEATGLERGVSSDRIHEEARQFKAREQAREIEKQAREIEEQKQLISRQETELAANKARYESQAATINQQKSFIATQATTIEKQKAAVAEQEQIMRRSVSNMQQMGKNAVINFDEKTEQLSHYELSPDKKLTQWRNWLAETSNDDFSNAPASRILDILQPLSNAITIVAMAAAAMATTLANNLARSIKEKEKMLAALTRQIKKQSVWKAAKGAFLSFLDKPANKQSEALMSEVAEAKAEAEEMKKASEANAQKACDLEQRMVSLRADNHGKDEAIQHYSDSLRFANTENTSLRNKIADIQNTIKRWNSNFKTIAEDLVDHASPELLQRYEARGLPQYIGKELWEYAKETKEKRKSERDARQQQEEIKPKQRGIHM